MEIARWETRGKDYLSLRRDGDNYFYEGNDCGGTLPPCENDKAAIAWMERPWGAGGAGPATVLWFDRTSLKRTK